MNLSPETYVANGSWKALLGCVLRFRFFFFSKLIACSLIWPLSVTTKIKKAEKKSGNAGKRIEYELPRLVANIEKQLVQRDVLAILDNYKGRCREELKRELEHGRGICGQATPSGSDRLESPARFCDDVGCLTRRAIGCHPRGRNKRLLGFACLKFQLLYNGQTSRFERIKYRKRYAVVYWDAICFWRYVVVIGSEH